MELVELMKSAGLSEVEVQYPFPDYKIPKAVFTHNAFQNKNFKPEDIISQFEFRDYSGEVHPSFNQGLTIPVLCRNGMMEDLSNSFLLFASRNKNLFGQLNDPHLLGKFYTTNRVNEFNIQTSFIEEENSIIVRKEFLSPDMLPNQVNGILFHDINSSEYINGQNLESEYRKCITLKDFERLSQLIDLQIEFLTNNAIETVDKANSAHSIIHPDFIDCIPSNLIIKNGKLHYIDKEWKVKEPVMFGVLLLRTIDAIHELGKKHT